MGGVGLEMWHGCSAGGGEGESGCGRGPGWVLPWSGVMLDPGPGWVERWAVVASLDGIVVSCQGSVVCLLEKGAAKDARGRRIVSQLCGERGREREERAFSGDMILLYSNSVL